MSKLLSGKKIGMTHIYSQEGKRYPVTVIDTEPSEDYKSELLDILKEGDFVDVTGTSKGKGFQGGVKRWNWSGSPKTHGSMSHRRVGSIGSSAAPSRVLKGRHMPGHMGNQKVTIQNLQVIKLDKENSLLVIKGAVPGHRNSKVLIKRAKKKPILEKAGESKEPPTEKVSEKAPEKAKASEKASKQPEAAKKVTKEPEAVKKASKKAETKTKADTKE